MITKADDYPIHQLPLPVSEVGTERNFYDRYFFNGYSKKEDFYFAAVLCLYPNLNIPKSPFRHIGCSCYWSLSIQHGTPRGKDEDLSPCLDGPCGGAGRQPDPQGGDPSSGHEE